MMSSDSLLPNYVEYYCNIKAALNHTIFSMILGNIFIPKLLRRWYFASGSSYRQQAGNNTIILLFPGANVTDVVVKTNHQSRNMAILPLLRIVKASKKWENLNTSILFEKVACTLYLYIIHDEIFLFQMHIFLDVWDQKWFKS